MKSGTNSMRRSPRGLGRRCAPQLGLEALESRLAMAGDVTLSIEDGGVLRIVGDAAANQIEIGQERGLAWVRGFTVNDNGAQGNTLIRSAWNGAASNRVMGIEGIRSIVIELGDGHDRVVAGTPMPRNVRLIDGQWVADPASLTLDSLTIRGNAGNDSILVGRCDIATDLVVTTGQGNDFVLVIDSEVGRRIEVNVYGGDNMVTFDGAYSESIQITAGDGNDIVSMGHFGTDSLTISTSGGGDRINIGPDYAVRLERVDALRSAKVRGHVTVNAGEGVNDVRLIQLMIDGQCVVTTGSVSDNVTVDQVTAGGLTVFTGHGPDTIVVRQAEIRGNVAVATAFNHNLPVVVVLDRVTSGGQISVTTARGADQVTALNVSATTIVLRTGEGNDTVRLVRVAAEDVLVELGAGDDLLTAAWVMGRRRTLFDGGVGSDGLKLDAPVPANAFRNFERVRR